MKERKYTKTYNPKQNFFVWLFFGCVGIGGLVFVFYLSSIRRAIIREETERESGLRSMKMVLLGSAVGATILLLLVLFGGLPGDTGSMVGSIVIWYIVLAVYYFAMVEGLENRYMNQKLDELAKEKGITRKELEKKLLSKTEYEDGGEHTDKYQKS